MMIRIYRNRPVNHRLPEMSRKSAPHGQNFLTDSVYADRIISTVLPTNSPILEVGPGKGILTERLIRSGIPMDQIWAVELDGELAQGIHQRWPDMNLTHADILKTEPEKLTIPTPFLLLSNLPYDISHPFFESLVNWVDRIERAVIMVQKEFADKICVQEKRSALGNMLAAIYETTRCFNVPPGAFRPSPQVKSSVLLLIPRQPKMLPRERKDYHRFLKTCFSAPRKTLYNNLRESWQPSLGPALEACSISTVARPENIESSTFLLLWHTLEGLNKSSPD